MRDILTAADILLHPPISDQDGYIATAHPVTGGFLELSYQDDRGPQKVLCTMNDAEALADSLGRIENLYYTPGDSGNLAAMAQVWDDREPAYTPDESRYAYIPACMDIPAIIEDAARLLHDTIEHPSAHWLITKPRKDRQAPYGMSAALLLSWRKREKVYRYLARICIMPNQRTENDRSMHMISTDVYHLYYTNKMLIRENTAFSDSVQTIRTDMIAPLLKTIIQSGIHSGDRPTRSLPPDIREEKMFSDIQAWLNKEYPQSAQTLKDIILQNYRYSGELDWSIKEAIFRLFGQDNGYQESLQKAWSWPGNSGFEI